jgi:hypothetical protein
MPPTDRDAPAAKRRPQWRGERQAVLVRLPADIAQKLRTEASRSSRSLSDTAAELIAAGVTRARP